MLQSNSELETFHHKESPSIYQVTENDPSFDFRCVTLMTKYEKPIVTSVPGDS